MTRVVPEWLSARVDFYLDKLGLREWEVKAYFVERIGTDPLNAGKAVVNWRYMKADLYYRDDIQDDEAGHKRVLHEVLHIWQWGLIKFRERVQDFVEERDQERVADAFDDENEPYITRQVCVFYSNFERDYKPKPK